MFVKRVGLVLAGALALTGVSACGKEAEPATVAVPPAIAATGSAPITGSAPVTSDAPIASDAAGHAVQVDGRTIGGVAPGLDLPPGSKVSDAFAAGAGATVILTEPEPKAVLSYYRESGPSADYRAVTDTSGLLLLEGETWSVTVVAQSGDSTLTFQPLAAASSESPAAVAGPEALTPVEVGVRYVPANFRFPPNAEVSDRDDKPTGASFVLTAPDSRTTVAFYRKWLPIGFFTVVGDRDEGGATTIAFTDDSGWAGTIFATRNRVAVTFKHS
ncbi:hypothetical protein [Actinoplanes sp. NPDC051494]|uniref:hypothetical protein n=1 Tax=Actinoplanes sp. NPDC051494 TaxID=3363907 RepID=UPI00378AD54D